MAEPGVQRVVRFLSKSIESKPQLEATTNRLLALFSSAAGKDEARDSTLEHDMVDYHRHLKGNTEHARLLRTYYMQDLMSEKERTEKAAQRVGLNLPVTPNLPFDYDTSDASGGESKKE
eukprot:Clim_evm96s11 gene=Clim_evmTU96s11